MGLERAWEQTRAAILEKEGLAPDLADRVDPDPGPPSSPARDPERTSDSRPPENPRLPSSRAGSKVEVTGRAIEELVDEGDAGARPRGEPSGGGEVVLATRRERPRRPIVVAAVVLTSATVIGGSIIKAGRFGRRRRRSPGLARESSGH